MILRPYQETMFGEIVSAIKCGHRSILAVAPTGSGKTLLASRILGGAAAKGKRSWFACHRTEILRQSAAAIMAGTGIDPGIIAAGFGMAPSPIQVCMVQTLIRRAAKLPKPDIIIWDEVHHLCSKSWSGLKESFPGAVHIGLTATPQRLDGRGLGTHFSAMVQGPSTADLIAQGYLSPYKLFAPSMADLKDVHTVAGDYNKSELDTAMRSSKVTGDAIAEYKAKCFGKRALMFLWSIKASEEMARAFNEQGIPAAHLDGCTDDLQRLKMVADFRDGRIKVLTNVEIVTEGFDLSAIEAVFLLRPTQSLQLYLQMVGRGLRVFPGKEFALIMDHAGLAFQHGLIDDPRLWSLEGTLAKDKKKALAPARQCPGCFGVMSGLPKVCKYCGLAFEIQYREVEQEAGELREVDPAEVRARLAAAEPRLKRELKYLQELEIKKGYKRGWAKHLIEGKRAKIAGQA